MYYKKNNDEKYGWLGKDIRINGITIREFRNIVKEVNFSKYHIIPTPLFSVGATSLKHPRLKWLSNIFKPFIIHSILEDHFSHRVVVIMMK